MMAPVSPSTAAARSPTTTAITTCDKTTATTTRPPHAITTSTTRSDQVATAGDDRAFIVALNANDVLFGRGAPSIGNEGNIRFRRLVQSRKSEYVATGKRHVKDVIARQVMDTITARRGRFVRKIESLTEADERGVPAGTTQAWALVGHETVVQKVKQALRDRDVESTTEADHHDSPRHPSAGCGGGDHNDITGPASDAEPGAILPPPVHEAPRRLDGGGSTTIGTESGANEGAPMMNFSHYHPAWATTTLSNTASGHHHPSSSSCPSMTSTLQQVLLAQQQQQQQQQQLQLQQQQQLQLQKQRLLLHRLVQQQQQTLQQLTPPVGLFQESALVPSALPSLASLSGHHNQALSNFSNALTQQLGSFVPASTTSISNVNANNLNMALNGGGEGGRNQIGFGTGTSGGSLMHGSGLGCSYTLVPPLPAVRIPPTSALPATALSSMSSPFAMSQQQLAQQQGQRVAMMDQQPIHQLLDSLQQPPLPELTTTNHQLLPPIHAWTMPTIPHNPIARLPLPQLSSAAPTTQPAFLVPNSASALESTTATATDRLLQPPPQGQLARCVEGPQVVEQVIPLGLDRNSHHTQGEWLSSPVGGASITSPSLGSSKTSSRTTTSVGNLNVLHAALMNHVAAQNDCGNVTATDSLSRTQTPLLSKSSHLQLPNASSLAGSSISQEMQLPITVDQTMSSGEFAIEVSLVECPLLGAGTTTTSGGHLLHPMTLLESTLLRALCSVGMPRLSPPTVSSSASSLLSVSMSGKTSPMTSASASMNRSSIAPDCRREGEHHHNSRPVKKRHTISVESASTIHGMSGDGESSLNRKNSLDVGANSVYSASSSSSSSSTSIASSDGPPVPDFSWSDLGRHLERLAPQMLQRQQAKMALPLTVATTTPDSATIDATLARDIFARQFLAAVDRLTQNPTDLAVMTVSLLEQLRLFSDHSGHNSMAASASGTRPDQPVMAWLDYELSRWAQQMNIHDDLGRPIPYTGAMLETPRSEHERQNVLMAQSAALHNTESASTIYLQVAYLTRLRSLLTDMQPDKLLSILDQHQDSTTRVSTSTNMVTTIETNPTSLKIQQLLETCTLVLHLSKDRLRRLRVRSQQEKRFQLVITGVATVSASAKRLPPDEHPVLHHESASPATKKAKPFDDTRVGSPPKTNVIKSLASCSKASKRSLSKKIEK